MILTVKREALNKLKGPMEVGPIEMWADRVHEIKGTDAIARVRHAMRCLIVYTRLE